MNINFKIKSILQVMFSNSSSIISGVFVGFLLPKIMPVESYGLYKTFMLYASYLGLFHLGIIDGIVLRYGERNYQELDRTKFRSYFKWYCIINAFFALLIVWGAIYIKNTEFRFIMISLAIYMISVNITTYFQQISQITMRFKELSIRKVFQSLFNVVIILILYVAFKLGNCVTHKYYVVLWMAGNIMLTTWYTNTYREIVFSNSLPLKSTFKDIKYLIKIGFPLLFANLCTSLILTIDRQFVNIYFDTATYAVYDFAYNMLSLITVATSAISTILYPVLKRTDNDLKTNYDLLVSVLLCFIFIGMLVYFPLSLFVKAFLPNYIDSIVIFRIIFPGLAISSTVTVIMHNYYKVFGDNLAFFKKSIVVLMISCIANYFAYKIFGTTISISMASIITMIFWYVYVEQYFVKKCGYRRGKNLMYLVLMTGNFYIMSSVFSEFVGAIIYFCLLVVISLAFFRKKISDMKRVLR